MDDQIGFGMKFARETNTPGTYANLARVKDIRPPSTTREAKDSTHHDVAGGYRTFIGGLRDAGEVGVTLAFDPEGTGYANLKADLDSNAPHGYRIILPGGEWAKDFDGLVTNLSEATPLDDQMVATATIKISGQPGAWVEL